jgi:hypothetical protein
MLLLDVLLLLELSFSAVSNVHCLLNDLQVRGNKQRLLTFSLSGVAHGITMEKIAPTWSVQH